MCELVLPCEYNPKACPRPLPEKSRLFTILLLYCWQREYDERPYRQFQFKRLLFEERIGRKYHCIRDFRIIVNYLLRRHQLSVKISSLVVSNWDAGLLKDFARSLIPVWYIDLNLMRFPHEFFVMLRLNAKKMNVSQLSLEGTPLTDDDVRILREFLLVSRTLRRLNVSHCSLTQYNFALIADGVHKSPGVRRLNAGRLLGLSLSLDTEKIASVLGSLLMQNTLWSLSLEHCELTAQDMIPIAEHLALTTSRFRRLRIACNKIGPDGAFFLLRGMSIGGMLELLDISHCSIGTHGGEWVAKYLTSCRQLRTLLLNNNDMKPEAVNLILLAMKKRCKLDRLTLYGNHFDSRSAMIVRRLLDAEVVLHSELDISYTYDEALHDYRVVPWR
ncbi:leucine-rich repeat-containing protein 34 [Drosophila takahashii]|uniref:leucine-rich repeat-containing protein 34 n=1 Tax=Drosophila takahashii TaxID=29030 RepID=UPI001CF8E8B1|nr:leucine-rich repeat-containing protein 34 [Drosophila takahashii]